MTCQHILNQPLLVIIIPITDGKLNLGTWQGIYLCEHRNIPTKRTIIATINGTKF